LIFLPVENQAGNIRIGMFGDEFQQIFHLD
jgi:hypothetical protein